jgi:hypothetical protein
MESPINKKIQRSLERSAAKKKKDSNYIPVLTLRQRVLSLVNEANANALQERQITPRSALIVMERALADLSTLSDESRDFGVLREVSVFISSAQKTFSASTTTHTDLLPQGNPLSALNASLTPEEYRSKYSQWLAADIEVSANARPLVAAAFSAQPGSLEREHAFMRLNVTKENVPGYFKIDPAPIVAAFSEGNSSSARRARVALQWRDKKGRWVEMGRGANFRYRMAGGGVGSASGVYVGTSIPKAGENPRPAGLIQVSGDANLPDGIYAVQPQNVETYSARIPTEALEKAGVTPGATPDQSMVGIPSQVDLMSTRRDAPTGWTKQDENTFTSDDNYTAKVTDGEYTLFRQNEDGSLGDKVGEAANWADINDLANGDQASYDEVKGQGTGAGAADEQVIARIENRTKYNEEFDLLEELIKSGVDAKGNEVPAGWEGVVKQGAMPEVERRAIGGNRVFGEEGLPYIEYKRAIANDYNGPVEVSAMYMLDGKFYANGKEYDSWDAAEADIPNWIAQEEENRGRSLEPIASLDETPDEEPPAPPSGGTPVKPISPSDPSAPGLFSEFEVPNGAFKFNTADYDVQGRVDERSTDFTDDPERLATKFTVQDLISAFSEAVIGNSSDAAVAEILNVNVGDDDELDAPSEVDVDTEIPQVNLGRPSGAGQLEFNAGAEFVPAESLFNALWHAGVDPNRVLANVYDSVTGDNKNLAKLIEAQGGTPSPEEAKLVDDITAEIRQIKDATPDGEPSIANQKDTPSVDLPGSLTENLPIDFENPDYYIPDPSAYIPSQPTVDENGYTDNPKDLATDYETSDLIMQMLEGITDGSGAALLNFGDITTEVPVEAIRDALQFQGVNTNDILVDLKRESNDMSEPELETPTLQAHSQMIKDLIEQTGNTVDDDTADKIRDAIDEEGLLDWSEANEEEIIDAITEVAGPGIFGQAIQQTNQSNFSPFADAFEGEDSLSPEQAEKLDSSAEALVNFFSGGFNGARIIAYNPQDGLVAASTRGTDLEDSQIILATAEGNIESSVIVDEDWFAQDGAQLGWKPMTQEVVNSIYQENGRLFPDTAMSAPVVEITEEVQPQLDDFPIDSPENITPRFVYPGPREAGYTANNTVLDSNGAAVGAGARVQALSDGRAGTIVAVQNIDTKSGRDADYVRVRFDDGSTAVRSARQIFGIDAGAPVEQADGPGQLPPARRNPVPQDPSARFNEPAASGTPVIAGDGRIPGVKLVDTPADIAEFANPDAKQSDYSAWGLRAPEIARAGRDRAAISNITDLIAKEKEARTIAESPTSSPDERDKASSDQAAFRAQTDKLIRDIFGIREGVQFGKNNYTIKDGARVGYTIYPSGEAEISIAFRIVNDQGVDVGEGSRTLRSTNKENPDGTKTTSWTASNNILKIPNSRDKKSGFVTAYNRYMEDWYIANGFDSVKVYAAGGGGWQGGFVWALNGFNWQASQASDVPRILRNMANRRDVTDEEKQIIKRMQDRVAKDNPTGDYKIDTVPTPLELALIGWYPGATNWIGKKQMISMSWYGQKRLNPEAIEQRQAINYDQSRNARKRIEDKLNRPGVSRELVLKANSNEFAEANPELAPYIDQIRDVLRSNRSLAVLSPAAKTALNRYTAGQLLKGEGRDATLQDIFKLRIALDAEFKADNPLASSKDFGVGSQLLDVSIEDVRRNRVPGFTVMELGPFDSGVNDTYMVTHNDSGQVFFVKKDSYATQFEISGPGAEVQADTMLRAAGVSAGYETRVSNVDPEILVMQRAGAGIPLLSTPMTAQNALGNRMAINMPDGTTIKVTPDNFMDLLHTPEDAVRIMLVDLIISNMDRHNNNLLLAVDGTDKTRIRALPIDHALSTFSPDIEGMQFTVQELFDGESNKIYGMAMPVLTKRLKQEEVLDIFRNEARVMMQELNNPANLPTGKELDLIIKNFGSIDAYRAKVQERIDSLLKPGGEGYDAFLRVLNPRYWSRNR